MILVGEMRDLETISTALTAAETGHLVFATLHTQDTPQTIDRIIDVFPPHQQQQVRCSSRWRSRAIVTQQLLPDRRRLGPGRGLRGAVDDAGGPEPDPRGQDAPDLLRAPDLGGAQGMQSMDSALAQLVREGKITRELAESRSSVPEELRAADGRRRDGRHEAQPGTRDGPRWPPTPSRPSTSRAFPPGARSRPSPSRRSPTSCAQRGLIVLDIDEQKTALDVDDLFERFKRVKATT